MIVGQTVWVETLHTRQKLQPMTVSKVGKKYFELVEFPREKFIIDTLMHDGGKYSNKYKCYLSVEDFNNKLEAEKLYQEVAYNFQSNINISLTVEQLTLIKNIINGK